MAENLKISLSTDTPEVKVKANVPSVVGEVGSSSAKINFISVGQRGSVGPAGPAGTITAEQQAAINANTAKNSYPSSDSTKLAGIESGAEVNVKANWNETDSNSDAFIQNKPAIPTDTNTTYSVSCVDGENSDEEKIRLTDSDGSTDDIVLEAGTGLSIARSGDKITFTNTVTDTDTVLTAEQVQDVVGAMFTSNTETRVSATYDDSDGTIDLVVDDMTADTNTQLTDEQVQDIVGAMVDGGTETNISVTYDDTSGKLNFVSTDTNTTYSEATSSDAGLMSTAHHDKLDGIADGAEVNVQSDWDSSSGDSKILNKPSLLQLGTTSTTAMVGDRTTISGAQASAITANTAKTGITAGQASAITANTAKVDLTVDGAGTVHENNYTNTTYSEATGSDAGLMSTAHHDKLDGIESSADVTDATNVTAAGALMDSELTDLAGIKSLDTSTLVDLGNTQTITGQKTFERKVILDGNKMVTASGDGVTLHVDGQNITDTSTSASGTATFFNHIVIENPSLLASNSSVTTTNASTVYIKGAPVASTNQTLTNSYALNVAGGDSYFGGAVTATLKNHKHFINFGVNLGYNYARWLPWGSYYIVEQTTDNNPEYTTYVAPYDGSFIKLIIRSEESLGDTAISIYKVGDGTEEPDQGSLVDTKTVDIASANTSYTYTFDSDATFSAGDAMSVKIQPTTDPVAAGVVGTFVLEFDLTT